MDRDEDKETQVTETETGTRTKTRTETGTGRCVFGTRHCVVPTAVCCPTCDPNHCLTASRSCLLRGNRGADVSVLHPVFRFHPLGGRSQSKPCSQCPAIQTQDSILSTPSRSNSKRSRTLRALRHSELWWRLVYRCGVCRWWLASHDILLENAGRAQLPTLTAQNEAVSPARTLMQGAPSADDMEGSSTWVIALGMRQTILDLRHIINIHEHVVARWRLHALVEAAPCGCFREVVDVYVGKLHIWSCKP